MSDPRILRAFRTLMRAQRTAFAQDTFMQQNARRQIRQYFEQPLPTKAKAGPAVLEEQLQQANEAAEYLLVNIIQAKKKDNGKFVMSIQPRHTVADPPEPTTQ